LLERLCEVLIEGRGQMLYQATSSRAVLEVLGGEAPADWPSAGGAGQPHGLHARPAKVLAQLAQGFEGDIRVRVVDSAQPAVSVKSLSKLLSRAPGVARCWSWSPNRHRRRCAAGAAGRHRARPGRRGRAAAAGHARWPIHPPEVLQAAAGSRIQGGRRARHRQRPGACCVEREFDYPLRGESCAQERRSCARRGGVHAELQALVQRSDKAIGEISSPTRRCLPTRP
jgi:phosphocarrier protein FPr